MSLLNALARQVMQPATIVAMQRIAAHTYRLSLVGTTLADWAYVPGPTLDVSFGLSTRAEAASLRKRTYPIWGYVTVGRIELAVCTFSDGPGAR